MTEKASFGAMSHVGQVRTKNDDAWYAAPDDGVDAVLQASRGILYAVADGVGGEKGGDRASLTALRTLSRTVYGFYAAEPEELLREGIEAANRQVRAEAEQDSTLRGMATTLTAVLVRDDAAYLAHVGDSRAYRLRGRELKQLSRDHKRVTELVDSGALTPQEAADHPDAHVITRAIGYKEAVDVDIERVSLRRGDRLLLCSDGLYDMVGDGRIRDALTAAREPRHAAEALIQLANDEGGEDNITVMVVDPLASASWVALTGKRRRALASAALVSGVVLALFVSTLGKGIFTGPAAATATATAIERIGNGTATVPPDGPSGLQAEPAPSEPIAATLAPTQPVTPTAEATATVPASNTLASTEPVVRFYANNKRNTLVLDKGDQCAKVMWYTETGRPTNFKLSLTRQQWRVEGSSGEDTVCLFDQEQKRELQLKYTNPSGKEVTLTVMIQRAP